MNETGWILLSRKLLGWQWWRKAEMVKLWLYLLLSANIEDKKWQGIEVKRGQLVTSRAHLAAAANLSEQTVRTCLARLQQTGEITIKTTKHYTLITICNYGIYQDYDPNNQPTTNQQSTNNQPTTNQQLTTTKQLTINNNNNTLSLSRAREEKNFFSEEQPQTSEPTLLETEKEKSSAQKGKDFTPPTVKQVSDFCQMHGLTEVNPTGFVAYYETVGWTINGRPMAKWQAAAINWNERDKQKKYSNPQTPKQNGNHNNRQAGSGRYASMEPRSDVSPDEF